MATVEEAKLILSIPKDLHATIKSIAALKHISVKDLIMNEILTTFKKELCEYGYEHKLNKKTQKDIEHARKHPEEMKTVSLDDFFSVVDNIQK